MLFFSNPGPKYTPTSNRLNIGEKLIITSSVTKDVYIRPCISLIKLHMQIYTYIQVWLPLVWWLEAEFFESRLMAANILCFEMTKKAISKIRLLIQITLCRNVRIQLHLSKNNRFSAEEATN